MATVRMPSSEAARKTRMAISLRFATMSFLMVRMPWEIEDAGAGEAALGMGKVRSKIAEKGYAIFQRTSGIASEALPRRPQPRCHGVHRYQQVRDDRLGCIV